MASPSDVAAFILAQQGIGYFEGQAQTPPVGADSGVDQVVGPSPIPAILILAQYGLLEYVLAKQTPPVGVDPGVDSVTPPLPLPNVLILAGYDLSPFLTGPVPAGPDVVFAGDYAKFKFTADTFANQTVRAYGSATYGGSGQITAGRVDVTVNGLQAAFTFTAAAGRVDITVPGATAGFTLTAAAGRVDVTVNGAAAQFSFTGSAGQVDVTVNGTQAAFTFTAAAGTFHLGVAVEEPSTSSSGWPGYILNGSGVARPMSPTKAERDELIRKFRIQLEIDRKRKQRQTEDELVLVDLL